MEKLYLSGIMSLILCVMNVRVASSGGGGGRDS
jgi:hypothetical protein